MSRYSKILPIHNVFCIVIRMVTIFLNNCLVIFILKCLSPNKKIYTYININ